MRIAGLITVVETPEFLAMSRGLFDEDQRSLLISYLAAHPLSGDSMPGTGGVRKLRWAVTGRGKRGGARVIYFVHSENLPLFLLTAYAKNARVDLSAKERAELKGVGEGISDFLREEEATMSSKVAGSIRRGLTQALAYAKHEAHEADFRVHVPAEIDVRAIRGKLGLTQAQFAARFAFSINTLRHWEQGKRRPEGPTRAYLQVIARTPRAVQRALRATSHGLK